VHVLKLDGSFLEGFQEGAGDTAAAVAGPAGYARRQAADEQIVLALVQLAHALGLTVTAEGVESELQADRLRAAGCDTAQGWHFGRAMPAEAIVELLTPLQ
jgi:EAL domain-containing protein (putative c-di-GMP-specific phosphodiesterase class I)